MILLLISFVAGILTVLAPCVLPLLPVIVGSSITGGVDRRRAYTITASLGVSVFLFTLLLKVSSAFIYIPQSTWEYISGGILIIFGILTIFPGLWDSLGFVNRLSIGSNKLMSAGYMKQSFLGDVLVGAALGPVFSSCSPTYFVILATVLPASFGMGLVDLTAYCIGLVLMLLAVALLGQRIVDKLGIAADPRGWFKRTIGALLLIVGILVSTGAERTIEAWLLMNVFDVTSIEQNLLHADKGAQLLPTGETASTTAADVASGLTPAIAAAKSRLYPKAPELVTPDGFINTGGKPITIGEFKGKKVVLIDIWTYSCINCQRTLPYLKDWYDKYSDKGLEIIGVHTPEFGFEKVLANVQMAVTRDGIKYPVILDNQYQTWNAFGNQYWPRKYLIDIDGYIVYDHAGEGSYDEAEKAIQKALAERDARLGLQNTANAPLSTSAADGTDLGKIGSPETYFGSGRNEYLANGSAGVAGVQKLTIPSSLQSNALYLGGSWDFKDEYAQTASAGAQIKFKYNSKSVFFVGVATSPVHIKVTRDGGQPLGDARGEDVAADGSATIKENRLYKLIDDSGYGAHTIEITIQESGLQAYTFTFG